MRSDTLNNSSNKYGGRVDNVVFVEDAAAVNINADNSGKIHVIPDLTADSTFTLPTEEVGLNFEFWYGGTAADAGAVVVFNFKDDPRGGTAILTIDCAGSDV